MSSTTSLGRLQRRIQDKRAEKSKASSPSHSPDGATQEAPGDRQTSGDPQGIPESVSAAIPIEADRGFYLRYGKRSLDLILCGAAVILLLPLFLICTIAIKLDTPGPVLYRSTRGEGGHSPSTSCAP